MKQLQLLLLDRRHRQRGSVLSALLIIVAFLAILMGALLTELTGSFTVSQDLVTRVKTEATVTSAAELAIHQLQVEPVPAVCAHDGRSPWYLTLNGQPAAVTQTCSAIVPEVAKALAAGFFTVDGIHDTVANRNRYLVSDSSGRLSAYTFGQTIPSWSIGLGGAPSASVLTALDPDGSVDILAPLDTGDVALFNERNGAQPTFLCRLAASASVSSRPGAEVTPPGINANFQGYGFFGDSNGQLYVYDASFNGVSSEGRCAELAAASVGGGSRVAGAPLVFPGRVSNGGKTVSDEVFVLVTNSSSTNLQHWRYTETTSPAEGEGGGNEVTSNLSQVSSLALNGGSAVGYATSASAPTSTTPLSLVIAAASGRVLDLARITLGTGASYSMAAGVSNVLPNGSATARAPDWCHCPGQDIIGVGATNGYLYLFNSELTSTLYTYSGQADGWPAINTTPMADAAGDWYFGANDGSVYDIEIPTSGVQMFKAAKFGPGGAIASSPIVGACAAGPCLYFASAIDGSYFVRIGSTRVSDLRACVSSAPGSTSCAANPRLWARVQVGPGATWGGSGVFVQGWSFYSP